MLTYKKPNVVLNPRTPGPHSEAKADAQPLSHPGIPINKIKILHIGAPGAAQVAQWFGAAFGPGPDPGD